MSLPVAVLVVFLWRQVLAVNVPPPTNVTFQCGNFQNTVRWVYNDSTAGLRFKVDYGQVIGEQSPGPLWVDPPDLQANMSFLSDPINEYFLTVTAVVGNELSEHSPSEGVTFSYNSASLANTICHLDLPPVNVIEHDNKVAFSFQHPWLFYNERLPPTLKSRVTKGLPVFKYEVVRQETPYKYNCSQEECTGKLLVDSSQKKHCVVISGELENMDVRRSQEYCSVPKTGHGNSIVVIAVVVALGLFAVAAIVCMVVRKLTQPSTSRPSIFQTLPQKENLVDLKEDVISVPETTEVDSPTPLLMSETLPAQEEPSSAQFDGRRQIGVENDNGMFAGADRDESQLNDDDDDDEEEEEQPVNASAYSHQRNMDEIIKGCEYTERHFDELEPGETVETYRNGNDSARK